MTSPLCPNLVVHSTLVGIHSSDRVSLGPPERGLGLAIIVQMSLPIVKLPGHSNVMPLIISPALMITFYGADAMNDCLCDIYI